MSGCLNLCPYTMNTNIGYESPNPNPNPSPNSYCIRRSLSADMCNQKWQQNNGFSLKRVQSSEQLQALGEEDYAMEKRSNVGNKGGAAFEDIWSSILSQKKLDGSGQVPPPYVHPLVKRSAGSLSEKSLEICTESLGSETGSDGLFPYPATEQGDKEPEQEKVNEEVDEENDDVVEVGKCKDPVNKRVGPGPAKSFPPALPTLTHHNDGSDLHIRTRRQDGRLVLEAVSVPSQNCFRAQRHNGRLLLTLTNDRQDGDYDEGIVDDEVDDELIGEDEVFDEDEEEGENVKRSSRMIDVHKSSSTMIMSKLMELTSAKNQSTWPRKHNKPVVIRSLEEPVKVEARQKDTNSLPPRPRVSTTTTAALNAYEYYWGGAIAPLQHLWLCSNQLRGNRIVTHVLFLHKW